MDPRVNYTLVGLFVMGLGGALAVAIIWLSRGTEDKVYQTYVAYVYESVAGLNPRAPVKYRGVEVGQVRRISLDKNNPERVRLVLDIEKGTLSISPGAARLLLISRHCPGTVIPRSR